MNLLLFFKGIDFRDDFEGVPSTSWLKQDLIEFFFSLRLNKLKQSATYFFHSSQSFILPIIK